MPHNSLSLFSVRDNVQKLENAKKLGVLSLSEHALNEIPNQIFGAELANKLRTLDLSKNHLTQVNGIGMLVELKTLYLDGNNLHAGSLESVSKLAKLQSLSVSGNNLGKPSPSKTIASSATIMEPLPVLPTSLKQVNLSANFLSCIPRSLVSASLNNLEKLDLSSNQLATVPEEICNLQKLEELRLDSNMIIALPEAIGQLSKLKVLSLRENRLQVTKGASSDNSTGQPLPKSLFSDTSLIDLNLHGNRLTNTQMNQFEGYQDFLDRRQKVKSKTMSNFDVCGLD
jgi:Leucine-rich repeat (LRR) protein